MGSEPVAYFITFRTYGSWLHGDPRGSMDREHNVVGTPLLDPDRKRSDREQSRLRYPPVRFDSRHRVIVEETIKAVSKRRDWTIHALDVRSNHVHVVISAPEMPERVMNALKSWCTRGLVEAGLQPRGAKAWSRHGSTRYLWRPHQVETACRYVCEGQGGDL